MKIMSLLFALLACATIAQPAPGQSVEVDSRDAGEAPQGQGPSLNIDMSARWTIRATASLWIPSLNGNQSLRGGPEFDIDIIDQAEVQAAPRYELAFRRDEWSVITSGFLFGIDQSATVDDKPLTSGGNTVNPGDRVRYDIDYWSLDLLVGYRFAGIPISNGGTWGSAPDPFSVPSDGVGLFFDVLGGARLWHLDYSMEAVGGPELIDQQTTWVDPVIGARMLLDLPQGYGLELRGDVGGFGIGSDFAWNVEVAFQAQLAENIGAEIGFRHLQTSYETGSGSDELDWDMAIAGLYASVVIRF